MIQNDVLNESRISTDIMRAITLTLKFAELRGNVVLNKGEANLPRKCVVNITQINSVDRRNIKEKISALSKKRVDEVESGLKLALGLA